VSNGDVAAVDKVPRTLDVIVKDPIATPPVAFAEKVILSCPEGGTGLGPAALDVTVAFGACGTVVIDVEPDVVGADVPAAFVARTVNVYGVAEASP
jgi:hypothetical protein